MEKISILIPVYNRESFIGPCIERIRLQTYPNIQLVIYDDGSTDNTVSIIQPFSSKMDINLIRGDKNRGASYARNQLLHLCNTQYAAWQDSDDISNIYRIEEQFKMFHNQEVPLVFCNWSFFRNEIPKEWVKNPNNNDEMNNTHCLGGSFIDISMVRRFLFDEDILMGGEDLVWLRKIEKEYNNHKICHRTLYYVRQHSNRISALKLLSSNMNERKLSDQSYKIAMDKINEHD